MPKLIRATLAVLSCGIPCAAMTTPSYSELMQVMRSYQESRLLLTAVELDVFTTVGKGASASQIAASLKTNPRATETFLNALVAIGALAKQDAIFRNTAETARYLVAGSPDYTRPSLLHTVDMWKAWSGLTDSVRSGTAAGGAVVETQDPRWFESFIATMHRAAETAAPALVRAVGASAVTRMLDVGGGSGAYSIAFAKANPNLRAEVLDLNSVVPIAQRHIDAAGLGDRVATRIGDLTKDDLGRGYDLILLSAICHMLSPLENRDLFRRSSRALAPSGRIVIRDSILEPDKTAPKSAALFAVHMLVATPGGSTYSEQEYRAWLKSAGFRQVTRPNPAGDLIIATR